VQPDGSGTYKLLVPTLLAAAAAYVHQLWKYNRDAYLARVDEACKLVVELADSGAKYWSVAKLSPRRIGRTPPASEPKSKYQELVGLELQIEGRVQQLQFFRLLLQPRFVRRDREEFLQRTADFQDALTGGQFGSGARAADLQRAKQIYATASDLVDEIRHGAARGNTFYRSLLRFFLPYRRPETRSGKIEEAILLAVYLPCLLLGAALLLIAIAEWLQ
jgi:hypothetical protein